MKFFIVLATVLAVSSYVQADGLSDILEPILGDLQPALTGANEGLQCGASQINKGVHELGSGVQHATSGVGSIAAKTVSGLGTTAHYLPAAAYHLTRNVQKHGGIVGDVANKVLGSNSHSH